MLKLWLAYLMVVVLMVPTVAANAQVDETGWRTSVYYTAVESFHHDSKSPVKGCLDFDCTGRGKIGKYPKSFIRAVKSEGTGRITSGNHAGMYLNWSYDVGYWLDSAPRDSYGNALIPFVSSASDTLPRGTEFRIVDCGYQEDGTRPAQSTCDAFKAADWEIRDEFTPGFGGDKHIDLYIGEEDMANFTRKSPKYVDLSNVEISLLSNQAQRTSSREKTTTDKATSTPAEYSPAEKESQLPQVAHEPSPTAAEGVPPTSDESASPTPKEPSPASEEPLSTTGDSPSATDQPPSPPADSVAS